MLLVALPAVLLLRGATPTPWGQQSEPEGGTVVRFAVIGDQGTGDRHQFRIGEQMARWHERLPFSHALTLGDNFYGPWFLWWRHGGKQYFKDRFDEPYAQLLGRGVRFHLSLGNHDVRTREGRDQIEDFERFHIAGEKGYYSFAAGATIPCPGADTSVCATEDRGGHPLVEFFALNTTRFDKGKDDPEQLEWLRRALAGSKARWKILFGHHPLYSTGKKHGPALRLRGMVEPLLEGRAQVALAGHDHIYERFHPQQGVVYFVCGSSGKLRRRNAKPDPRVAASEDRSRAFMLWEATQEELRFRAINEGGEAFDCGRIRPGGEVEEVSCREWPGLTVE